MEWQPIETAPKDWTDVILFDPACETGKDVVVGYFSHSDGGDNCWKAYGMMIDPTHWMPLPEPPRP